MVKKTAEQWNDGSLGYEVLDPDGWPRDNPEEFNKLWYQTPVTLEEFEKRAITSTCRFEKGFFTRSV